MRLFSLVVEVCTEIALSWKKEFCKWDLDKLNLDDCLTLSSLECCFIGSPYSPSYQESIVTLVCTSMSGPFRHLMIILTWKSWFDIPVPTNFVKHSYEPTCYFAAPLSVSSSKLMFTVTSSELSLVLFTLTSFESLILPISFVERRKTF